MKFSEKWLRQMVNPSVDVNQLAERVTLAGLEVDSISPVAGEFTGVVVGEVVTCKKHPDANKLNLCTVNIGTDEPAQIICGAANVRQGLKVAVATLGAVLPGNFKIKRAKLRGVESFGMICSESELGLAESSDGIMELPDDAPVGTDFREYLHLDDHIIDIELTPNRGDAASVLGVARDVAALFDLPLQAPEVADFKAAHDQQLLVNVDAKDACPHYMGCLLTGINNQVASPIWLQEVLRRSGMRSINPVVDVTNYVMLELGQPCHAFDASKLEGDIGVRFAKSGEKIQLLDESDIELVAENLLITATDKPVALAGVMGGANSEVSRDTTSVFIESANFDPVVVRRSAKAHHLSTDASYRYERGVDPALPQKVLNRVVQLLTEIVGGEAGPTSAAGVSANTGLRQVSLQDSKLHDYLGMHIDADKAVNILQRLGFEVQYADGVYQAKVPSYRSDVTLDVDLIEEIGRIYGYSNIPAANIHFDVELSLEKVMLPLSKLRQQLVALGYSEVINYSFNDPKCQKHINAQEPVALANPMAADQSVMRTSLVAGLLQTAAYNIARQHKQLALFEVGKIYLPEVKGVDEQQRLGMLISGERISKQWSANARSVDFFDLKGDIERLLTNFDLHGHWQNAVVDYLHPGQSAAFYVDGCIVATLGKVHPTVLKAFGLKQDCFVLDMSVESFFHGRHRTYQTISKYPAVNRDLAFLVDDAIKIADLEAAVRGACKEILKEIVVFDVYRGEGVPAGQKSVAIGMVLQNQTQTLDESEITAIIQRVIAGLQREFNITLRA